MDIPDDFRCPISLEVMTDPVILTSGHTFDRSSIQRWLGSGNLTCPLTNLPILTPPIPNHSLRSLILSSLPTHPLPLNHNPATSHPSRNSSSTPPQNSSSAPGFSQNYNFTPQSLSSLLTSIQKSAEFRQKVAESFLPKTLLSHVAQSSHLELQKLAIYSLLYLSLESDDIKVGLVAEGAVDSLVNAVKSNGAVKSNAAAAATVITSLATADVNKFTIGAHPHAISGLISMLLEGSSKREKKEALTAIYELCKFSENRKRVLRVNGSVMGLINLAGSGMDRAVEVLGQLVKSKEGRNEIGKCSEEFFRVFLQILQSGTQRGVESAILVLGYVCLGEEKMRVEGIRAGVLGGLEKLCEGSEVVIVKSARRLLENLMGAK